MFTCDGCNKDYPNLLTSYTTSYGAEYELCEECLQIHIDNDKKCEEMK